MQISPVVHHHPASAYHTVSRNLALCYSSSKPGNISNSRFVQSECIITLAFHRRELCVRLEYMGL